TRPARRPRLAPAAAGFLALWAVAALGGAARAEARVMQPHPDCALDEQLFARMISEYPEADADGNGELTRTEACAYQELLLSRRADVPEIAAEPEFPRLVCEEAAHAQTCTEDHD
ncbi:MAG TPA: hypothetical protein VL172_10840, partial [Kofleriaceae bacterium]|nr:hypothetical protein [Kofleriaceae bacterium]